MKLSCYFVTGASGFVGRELCRQLRARGHRVLGLVRGKNSGLEALGVEVISGDLSHPEAWDAAWNEAEVILHCAARASFDGTAGYEADNVDGTRRLLEAARRAPRLRRLVFVSTIGAVDRAPGDACAAPLDEHSPLHPTSAYGRSKRAGEKLVRESGLKFSIVRPALVIGREMRAESHFAVFVRSAVRRSLFARIAWPGAFSVVSVEDLAAALVICAEHPDAEGRTFFCAGERLALRECFAAAQPGAWRLPVGWAAGLVRAVPALVPFKLKALLLPALTADDAPLQQLGWQPRRTPAAALDEVIARERARCDPALDPGGQTIITGAASGLGAALVERLAPLRSQLLLVDRDQAGLERLREKFPHCRTYVADLADESAVTALVASTAWREHAVRELFLCAGLGRRGPMLASHAADHATVFKVNVLARLALAHAAVPEMLRAHLGRVVFISSSSAFQPLPYLASYAASNAALLFLGEAWAAELAGSGVHLLQVCPGGMRTNFQRTAGVRVVAGENLMPPEEVADAILRALARQKVTVVISLRAQAMAGLARVLPRHLSLALWRRLMARLR